MAELSVVDQSRFYTVILICDNYVLCLCANCALELRHTWEVNFTV